MRGRRRHPRGADRALRDAVLGAGVLLLVLVAGWLSTVAIDGGPLASPYTVRISVPGGAPLLKDGDDVRIAGRRAGVVRRVRAAPTSDGTDAPPGDTLVTLALDEGPVGRDAEAAVRLRGVAGATYVALRPGDASRPLPDGSLLRGPAAAATQLSDVAAAFDASTRRALRRTIRGAGEGLRERGDDLNHALAAAPRALERTTPLLRAAAPRPGALGRLLGDAGPVLRALHAGGDLARIAPGLRRVVAAVPTAPLGELVDDLPPAQDELAAALPEVDRLLRDAGAAAPDLRAATAALGHAVPPASSALARASGIQAFRRLGGAGTPVLRDAPPVLREARDPSSLLAPVSAPLGPLASYLAPYRRDIVDAVTGFDRWGDFAFGDGAAPGARAVRFSMVLTCHRARDPYPAPGEASKQREACR